MEQHKINTLSLEDDLEEETACLFAIHASTQIYRLAYLINKVLGINLYRKNNDVELLQDNSKAIYPLYHYFDRERLLDYYIIANKSTVKSTEQREGGLFGHSNSYFTYLIPEHRSVDFFLKIEGTVRAKESLLKIKKINRVSTVYPLNLATIKSHKNLIFE